MVDPTESTEMGKREARRRLWSIGQHGMSQGGAFVRLKNKAAEKDALRRERLWTLMPCVMLRVSRRQG